MGQLKSLAATVLACAVSLANSGPRDDEVASVTVSRATRPEGVVYSYALTNRGILPIIGLKIGYDFYRGEVQLSGSRPTLLAPPSWAGTVISLEESDRFEIDWEVESRDAAIGPGQTVALFRAILPAENSAYQFGHWTVAVAAPPSNASGRLQFVQGPGPGPEDPVPAPMSPR